MRLGQVSYRGRATAALFKDGKTHLIPGYTMLGLIQQAEADRLKLTALAKKLAKSQPTAARSIIPLHPSEVWACGCTYERSAIFRDGEHGTREGFYSHIYKSPRPELFFKGTARMCSGPGEPIGLRSDSKFTAPEPELCAVLGSKGNVIGYTVGNDVSAWDIERENPLFLPQSKIFSGCCSLGPVIVTEDELPDPYNLTVNASIIRKGKTIFEGATSTGKLARKINVMVEYLMRGNPIPAGTVLMTGTGIIVTEELALKAGDIVTIRIPEIGILSNTVQKV